MTDKVLAPLPKLHFTDSLGNDAVGWKLFIYEAGTTTKAVTWTDATGLTPNTNPIILDARGECSVWFDPATPVDIDPLPAFAPGPQGPDGRPGPAGPVGPPGLSNEPSVIRDLSISDIMGLNDAPYILLASPGQGYYYVVTLIVMQSTIIGHNFNFSGGLFFFYRSTAGLDVPVSQIAPGDPTVLTETVNSVDAILSQVTHGDSFDSGIAPLSDVSGNPVILAAPVQWIPDADPGPIFKATINVDGALYAINDTVTVDGGGGDAILTVTGVDGGGAVTAFVITDAGTGYSFNTGNATTTTLGAGSGLTVDIYVIAGNRSAMRVTTYYRLVPVFVASGAITSAAAASGSNAGTGYLVGDEGTVDGGDANATYRVTSTGGSGEVLSFVITWGGSAYTVGDNVTTSPTSGGGSGFEIAILAVAA